MVVSRVRIVLSIKQLKKRILLGCVGLKRKDHPLHKKFGGDFSSVVLRNCQRMSIALKNHPLLIIDIAGDTVARLNGKGVRGRLGGSG
jgi:hypothetical protein